MKEYTSFYHHGHPICLAKFSLCRGKILLRSPVNGYQLRMHKCKRKVAKFEDKENTVKVVKNYACFSVCFSSDIARGFLSLVSLATDYQ